MMRTMARLPAPWGTTRKYLLGSIRPIRQASSANQPPTKPHIPVLLNEVLENVNRCLGRAEGWAAPSFDPSLKGGRKQRLQLKALAEGRATAVLAERSESLGSLVCLDGTLGAGGHAKALLQMLPELTYIGLDRDPQALAEASHTLSDEIDDKRATIQQGRFSTIGSVLQEGDVQTYPDMFLFDLGVSSMQLDRPERGFSFVPGPLDMRMGPDGETLLEFLERSTWEEISDVIRTYGDERLSNPIARALKKQLEEGQLLTTADITGICNGVYRFTNEKLGNEVFFHKSKGGRMEPSTRTMQALRIAVNDEIGELERMLATLPFLSHPAGGTMVLIISFHGAEDRVVKHTFRRWSKEGKVHLLTRRAIQPTDEEAKWNPRARSAKLRVCQFLPRDNDTPVVPV